MASRIHRRVLGRGVYGRSAGGPLSTTHLISEAGTSPMLSALETTFVKRWRSPILGRATAATAKASKENIGACKAARPGGE